MSKADSAILTSRLLNQAKVVMELDLFLLKVITLWPNCFTALLMILKSVNLQYNTLVCLADGQASDVPSIIFLSYNLSKFLAITLSIYFSIYSTKLQE